MRAIRSATLSVLVVAALWGAAWEAIQARPMLRAIATEGEAIAMAEAVMGRRLEGQAVQVKFKDLEDFLQEDDEEDEDCDEYVLAGEDEEDDEDVDEDCDEYEIADEKSEKTVSMNDLKSLLGTVMAAGDEKPKKSSKKHADVEEEEEGEEEEDE